MIQLIEARSALYERWSKLWSEMGTVQSDIDNITAMLARYGYVTPAPAAASEGDQFPPESIPEPPREAPVETLESAVRRLIANVGPLDATKRFCEWLLENDMVAQKPATVRSLLEAFPPPLRDLYNKNRPNAIETLRGQIKSWIARDETRLTYADGYVGLSPVAVIEDRTA